jgi:hypothetical protein
MPHPQSTPVNASGRALFSKNFLFLIPSTAAVQTDHFRFSRFLKPITEKETKTKEKGAHKRKKERERSQ